MNSRPQSPTLQELNAIVGYHKELAASEKEFQALIRAQPEKFKQHLTPPYYWATVYEQPIKTTTD